jgi:hypothetical protein
VITVSDGASRTRPVVPRGTDSKKLLFHGGALRDRAPSCALRFSSSRQVWSTPVSTRPLTDGRIEPMSDASRPSDPSRPRHLGVWVAVVLLLVLFGGASSIVADVLFRLALGI